MSSLRAELQAGVQPAMKARDTVRGVPLRTARRGRANAEAVDATGAAPAAGLYANEAPRRALSGVEAHEVVAGVRDELAVAAAELRVLGQDGAADELRRRADVLDAYLSA